MPETPDTPADAPSAVPPSAAGWPTVLDAVVVYAAGALCTRLATGVLPAAADPATGAVRLRLTGLPAGLDAGAVRARLAAGPAGWRITAVRPDPKAAPRPAEDAAAPAGLLGRHRAAAARVAALELRERLLAERAERIAGLRAVPPKPPRDAPAGLRRAPAAALLALADFVEERLAGLEQEAERLRGELAEGRRELERLAEELARASDAEPAGPVTPDLAVLVVLTPDEPGLERPAEPVTVELEYRMAGARWVPSYQLSHRQGAPSGTLALRAAVAQRTGEDWTGVRLALSTADLHRPSELPRLRSLRIGRRQPAPAPSGWREPPGGLPELFTDYDGAPARPFHGQPLAVGGPALRARRAQSAPQAEPLPSPPPPAPSAPAAYGLPRSAPLAAPVPPGGPAFGSAGPGGPALDSAAPDVRRKTAAPAQPWLPPEPAGPPAPAADQLDYGALVLAGPEEPPSRRGRLHPPAPDAVPAPAATAPLPRHAVPPRQSAGSFDQRYEAAARVDLPSDGAWHTVTLTELTVRLAPEYLCVPSLDDSVFATLLLTNDTPHALLAGPLEVTVDGTHLLSTALPTLAPGGVRRVGLGVAQGIRATRRTETQESAAGLRGGTTVVAERIHVELANHLPRPVLVEVRERVPVAQDRDVRVDEQPSSPAWETPESPYHARGTRCWRVELAPGATAALSGGWEIRFPAGKGLVGGNRRS
ncbi:DUF4139 domain-containing protein [Kitasatospora sp. NPDC006697]|uniref:DUF4139 domain-containing protein n=1 Tax=Kitasatospora sp. NPDC006697 TaxID=3364020 RepID=UPI00368C90EE